MTIKNGSEALSKGDEIEVSLGKKTVNGAFLRYEENGEITIIKLKSGYDLALSRKEINSVKVLVKAKEPVEIANEKGNKTGDKKFDIYLIATGGTIASKIDYSTGGVSPSLSSDYYIELAPEMEKYGIVKTKGLMNIFSENMLPQDWVSIAKEAYSGIKNGATGIIITMGTDTMHFAASMMSFLLNPLSVPVVFTAAQRSSDRGSSDARTNLILSSLVASKWEGGESVICMHAGLDDGVNFILRGNKSRKMHTERRDAFRPINTLPLGKAYIDGRIENISEHIPRAEKTVIDTKLDPNVRLLYSYPGMTGDTIKYYVDKGVHGIVIAGTGFGNMPLGDKTVVSALRYADKKDIPVIVTSQTVYGATNKFVYSTLRELSLFKNIMYLGDMTTETAFVKLMFSLGHTRDIDKIRNMMETSLAGEISERHLPNEFLI